MYVIMLRYRKGQDWKIYTPPGEQGPVILDRGRGIMLIRSLADKWTDVYEYKLFYLTDVEIVFEQGETALEATAEEVNVDATN